MIYKNYDVLEDGSIFSIKTGVKLKPIKNDNDYYQVTLYNDEKELWSVHRLIATLFIPNPENKPCVGHKDCDTSNNCVENLYWCTYPENNNHPITLARKSESMKGNTNSKGRVLTEEHKKKISLSNGVPIIQYDDNGFYKEWNGIQEAARELGFNAGNISACCRGERKTHKSFKWAFK